ncbi:MAG TPA: YetF domain-containing protein [Pseudonocardiaceae bacterium]|nr:YetF domain-containing protein [Pseudonocardiaceae bacterium]
MPGWLIDGWTGTTIAAAKAVLMYLVALLGLRFTQRRTLSQWTAIDFAAAVAIGAIVGRTAVASDQSFAVGAVALLTILVAHWIVDMGRFHPWICRLVEHRVRVLVAHGRLRRRQLRLCGLTDSEVLAQLRQQGVGSLSELRYVLYEAKGELTVVREPGENVPDPEFVQLGLQDAAGFAPERAPGAPGPAAPSGPRS